MKITFATSDKISLNLQSTSIMSNFLQTNFLFLIPGAEQLDERQLVPIQWIGSFQIDWSHSICGQEGSHFRLQEAQEDGELISFLFVIDEYDIQIS